MYNVINRNIFFVILLIVSSVHGRGHKKSSTIKYILQWTSGNQEPLVLMPTGQQPFIGCVWDNCFITRSKHYFNDITQFDAILFRASDFARAEDLPLVRNPKQKYVFVSQEPASIYPLGQRPTHFFNMTWTYKLDSDITFRNIIVKNRYGEDIGPQRKTKWINIDDMLPTDEFLISKLANKSKAVAWIETNCLSLSRREEYVAQLNYELANLGLGIDTYGQCGSGSISNMNLEDIFRLLETKYYFYLALEKTFDEDYVTEQLLFALQHFTVPIVYGGANYSRFMPDGIYLNARELSPKEMAQHIKEAIEDKELYYDYFRWRGYYSFFDPVNLKGENEYCKFCGTLNNANIMAKSVTYLNLAEWWNRPPSYRPQMYNENYTKPDTHSKRLFKKTDSFTITDEDRILLVTDVDYSDSGQLELETEPALPRAFSKKIFKTGSTKKTRKRKSKKKTTYSTARSTSNENYGEDIEHHEHSHNIHEHDNHEHEEHEPLRFQTVDRVLEWHDDLPEPTRKRVQLKTADFDKEADIRHLNFFFDVPTLATETYKRNKKQAVPTKKIVVSVDICFTIPK